MKNRFKVVATLLVLLIASVQLNAVVRLAPIFSDNMVIQRDKPVVVWGVGVPGSALEIVFGGKSKQVVVNSDSTWTVQFSKQKVNTRPQSLEVRTATEKLILRNILIGDVWICSGQSNMEFPMQREMHFKSEQSQANQPLIRMNNPAPVGRYVYGEAYNDSLNKRLNNRDFYRWETWQNCGAKSFRSMSAIAYYFAKSILLQTGIPIGIVNMSIGGAPIESFISREAMAQNSQFAAKVKPGNWLNNNALPEWIRTRGEQNVGSNPSGYQDDLGLNHAYKPGFPYECGIKPLLPFPIKGVIWYQGESNALEEARVNEYPALMHLLINDYRRQWKNSDMPIYWVQLSSIDTVAYQSRFWPIFRDGQRQLMAEVKNGGMAVCSDLGFKNDVHPTNKKDVGERLARWALKQTYGLQVVPSGPLPIKARFHKGMVVIEFRFAKGLKTADGQSIRGFSLDGKNDIEAVIDQERILIRTAVKPAAIYYGWKPFSDANLVNAENLPASTFKIVVAPTANNIQQNANPNN